MSDLDNNPNGDGIEELSEKERKETQEIIKEIASDTQASKPEEKPEEKVEPKKPDEKPKEEPKDKPSDAEDKKPDEKSRKQVKLIPAWVHETAKSTWEKKEAELNQRIIDAAKGSAKDKEEVKDKDSHSNVDTQLRKKTDEIANKYGVDPDEEYERALAYRDSLKPENPKMEIPKEITEGLDKINKYEHEKQVEAEEAHFNSDFTNKILPLIKTEYGNDVPASTIEDLKEKVKAKAYSEDYAKVPLTTIYRGEEEFRDVIPKKQAGSEKSRGGFHQSQEVSKTDEMDLTTEQPDSVVAKMTEKEFDTYSTNMAKKEKH